MVHQVCACVCLCACVCVPDSSLCQTKRTSSKPSAFVGSENSVKQHARAFSATSGSAEGLRRRPLETAASLRTTIRATQVRAWDDRAKALL